MTGRGRRVIAGVDMELSTNRASLVWLSVHLDPAHILINGRVELVRPGKRPGVAT